MRGKLGFFAGKRYRVGETWTLSGSNNDAGAAGGIAYGDDLFVLTAEKLLSSSDGVTWTTRSRPASQSDVTFIAVTYGSGLWVAGGFKIAESSTSVIATSADGITWTARTHGSVAEISDLAYGGGLYVAVDAISGSATPMQTSSDGITWTSRSLPSSVAYGSVAYGGGLFVAAAPLATSNHIVTSSDGITWTGRNVVSGAQMSLGSVGYGDGLWIVAGSQAGSSSRIWTSSDAITWTARGNGDGFGTLAQGVAYGDGRFVVVGQGNSGSYITTSDDGTSWTSRTNPNSSELRGVVYGKERFVASMFDQQGTSVPALVSA